MSRIVNKQGNIYLYQQVIDLIKDMQSQGTLGAGEKLPSLRAIAQKLSISIPTVQQAYQELERQGVISAREKSGFYLNAGSEQCHQPRRIQLARQPVAVNKQALIEQVFDSLHRAAVVPLGIANPVAVNPTDKVLSRTMRRVMNVAGHKAINYGPLDGFAALKKQIINRYLDFAIGVNSDELIITNGAQEALHIAVQCVTQAGDIVAIESPCYFGIIEMLESLGLKVIEIPMCPQQGVCVEDLQQAFAEHDIKACIFSTSISNPLGSKMPEERRRRLVHLVEDQGAVLIEDDVYGELAYEPDGAKPAQYYSTKGKVITCSSLSKTAAPSYRVGWMIAGKFAPQARRLKRAMSCASSLMNQWTLYEFMNSGDYDKNLRVMRQRLALNKERMRALVQRHFPPGTRMTNPQGGCVLWLQLPSQYDVVALFHLALEAGISITPGAIFSATDKYRQCLRLSFGVQWSEEIEKAVARLGALCLQVQKGKAKVTPMGMPKA
ncbi:aminotransferase-like domain-containing protein [Pseudoalteromonas sp. T1lg10]|uniref:aminotransferase-like domain-containing protein n=1 Tax=Pseudoalteromonas sp. T1lg10 TaxID=2077093 RepID=UPI000CF6C1A8|nr:PLP-dependent aminotransferase family protein [Pseudoalteromonas sp. T1lg10]